ncbi:MAG: MarR family transcriptional regulator [Chloroflexia bacterium]|nr:MarR family transcriptional regulator [Chloroflexia bacterium]
MDENLAESRLAAWRAFLNAHAAVIGLIEREMTEAGQLPLSSYDVLVALSQASQKRLRMHELADRVVLSRSGLTRLVDRLEVEGLLTRERCGTDKRGAYAVLTQKGREALREAWPAYARGISEHFASILTDPEVELLTGILRRVSAAARPAPSMPRDTGD